MKKIATIVFLLFASAAFAQQQFDKEAVIKKSLANVQQHGSFYFLPIDIAGFANLTDGGDNPFGDRTAQVELVLELFDRFEKEKGLDVVTFSVARDQRAYFAFAYFHGIFLKAKPVKH